jgi:hypothetical protein
MLEEFRVDGENATQDNPLSLGALLYCVRYFVASALANITAASEASEV